MFGFHAPVHHRHHHIVVFLGSLDLLDESCEPLIRCSGGDAVLILGGAAVKAGFLLYLAGADDGNFHPVRFECGGLVGLVLIPPDAHDGDGGVVFGIESVRGALVTVVECVVVGHGDGIHACASDGVNGTGGGAECKGFARPGGAPVGECGFHVCHGEIRRAQ